MPPAKAPENQKDDCGREDDERRIPLPDQAEAKIKQQIEYRDLDDKPAVAADQRKAESIFDDP